MNNPYKTAILGSVLALTSAGVLQAQSLFVDGGVTSVSLDTATLAGAGLTLTGSFGTVDALFAGGVNFATVGFAITPSTSFAYTETTLAPFTGTIEHSGGVTFDVTGLGTASFGDFSIGFDATRVTAAVSGFFVRNTLDGGFDNLILFDIGTPGGLSPGATELLITGSTLLVAPELASGLGNVALTGAVVGLAQVNATSAIPEPSTYAAFAGLGALGLAAMRRRRSAV